MDHNEFNSNVREEITAHYAPSHDSSFVMKTTYNDKDEVIKIECVGWYCGEPDDELTQTCSHGGEDLIAIL